MNLKSMLTFFLLSLLLGFLNTKATADDGKLLRGQKWPRFSLEENKVDFYVAPHGSDSWSGRLAAPNHGQSEGPFVTLERAQRAVRELKTTIYLPKGSVIKIGF